MHRLQNFSGTTAPFPLNQYGQILVDSINPPITGKLKDKYNNPVQANITVYQRGTDSVISMTKTNSTGDYRLSVPPGRYDVQFDILSIPNFFVKLISTSIFTKLQDIINYMSRDSGKVSFLADVGKTEEIQVHSDRIPSRILVDGKELTKVSSYSELANNTWFYNSTEKKLYISKIILSHSSSA